MAEASEQVSAPNTLESEDGVGFRRQRFDWRTLIQRAVRGMFVVVTDVDREDSFEVSSAHDQDPVETFATDGADPPFDEGIRARCAYGCADCSDAVGAEHLVEGRGELAVAVVDQKARPRPLDERRDRCCVLAVWPTLRSGSRWFPRDAPAGLRVR